MPELVRYLLRKGAKKHALNSVRKKPPQANAPPRSGCASSAAFKRRSDRSRQSSQRVAGVQGICLALVAEMMALEVTPLYTSTVWPRVCPGCVLQTAPRVRPLVYQRTLYWRR